MGNSDIITTVTNSIQAIEGEDATAQQILQAMEFIKRLSQVYWQLKERMEAAATIYIQNHGPIQDGDRRVYLAPNKTTKCKSNKDTMQAVLEASGGDVDAIIECLSTSAFKPATTKKLVGKLLGEQLFETKETVDVKTGKPSQDKLQDVDLAQLERFRR